VSLRTWDSSARSFPQRRHCHREEIWCQVKGKSLLLFGNRLYKQEPGEAFLIPPNRKVPHSSINHTGEHMLWLYFGNRHDNVKD